ncbi:MAG TPA: histidine kinase dimerization/phosphoacceptor domain -containing protein [Caulobacteraceae bacterium]|nr:histidine kinase dimerization/phosphoacceptor domain -containing protein [Caulobacteraceae bacterium]
MTAARTSAEQHVEHIRQRGGPFVEAVRLTRMPMLVTDATLPGNPITFANDAFVELSGYTMGELLGQDPHFMNGPGTDPAAITCYQASIKAGRDESLEILQYRKDGQPFRAALFASPLEDGQGTVVSHFLSYLDITRRYEAEKDLRALTGELEARVASRTEELQSANDQLTSLLAERDLLMVEVNHRAKNSLAVAAALLGVQGRLQKDEGVRVLFDEAQDRLQAMARVHDLLSKSESSQRVDVAVYVNELCAALSSLTAGDDRIKLAALTEPGILVDAAIAFPLGIVMTELITNAVKYAFPAPRGGSILAEARRRGPGHVELQIRDNGVGMTDFREGALGYGLVRTLVRQMQGELEIKGDGGVTVTVSIPLRGALEA